LILYFIVLAGVILEYRAAGFVRTPAVHGLTFALYIVTGLVIFLKPTVFTGLSLITISGIVDRVLALYSSALYVGIDVYTHNRFAEAIAAGGSLEPLSFSKYFYAPAYHLLNAYGQLLFEVSARDASVLISVITVLGPVLSLFAITRYFFDTRMALLTPLLFVGSDHAIFWGISTIPTSLGVVFVCFILLSVIGYLSTTDRRLLGLFTILFVGITLSHQASTFIITIMILTFSVFYMGYRSRRKVL